MVGENYIQIPQNTEETKMEEIIMNHYQFDPTTFQCDDESKNFIVELYGSNSVDIFDGSYLKFVFDKDQICNLQEIQSLGLNTLSLYK